MCEWEGCPCRFPEKRPRPLLTFSGERDSIVLTHRQSSLLGQTWKKNECEDVKGRPKVSPFPKGNFGDALSIFTFFFSTRSERAMMVVVGIRQMLSLPPENVINGRASSRIFGLLVCTIFVWSCRDSECEDVKGVPKVVPHFLKNIPYMPYGQYAVFLLHNIVLLREDREVVRGGKNQHHRKYHTILPLKLFLIKR